MLASSAAWAEQPMAIGWGTLAGSLRIKDSSQQVEDGKPQVKPRKHRSKAIVVIMADSTDLAERLGCDFVLAQSYKGGWDRTTQQWQSEWMQAGQRMKLDLSALVKRPHQLKESPAEVKPSKIRRQHINSDVRLLVSVGGPAQCARGRAFPAAVLVRFWSSYSSRS